MATVLISGGTGLIGTALADSLLRRGYQVIILTRQPKQEAGNEAGAAYAVWDTEKQHIDSEAIRTADYIVNLAGAGVAEKRWTKKRKKEILDSRVKSGTLLVKALGETANQVKAVISMSAIGWYGPDAARLEQKSFKEDDPPHPDFLGKTCQAWEQSILPVAAVHQKRLVVLRTGIVLANEGGALQEFKKPLKFGTAAILGSGNQIISWIHIDDLVRMIIYAIETETVKGVFNAVAPHPVSNKELTLTLAREKKGRFFIPVYVPAFLLRWILGEMSVEVLKSATVSCEKIRQAGFTFLYPSITAAIRQLAGA
jgi:uncharacterized protein (TIGR01777 family)